MTKITSRTAQVHQESNFWQPRFVAMVAGKKVSVTPQPQDVNDTGCVRLGTSHTIWDWLFGKRG